MYCLTPISHKKDFENIQTNSFAIRFGVVDYKTWKTIQSGLEIFLGIYTVEQMNHLEPYLAKFLIVSVAETSVFIL